MDPTGLSSADYRVPLLGTWDAVVRQSTTMFSSAIHIGEDLAGDPDRHKRFTPENPGRVTLNHPEKGEIEIELTSMMGHTRAFDELEELLRSRGQIRDGKIGEARCQVMDGADVVEGTVEILSPHPTPHGNIEDRM